MKTYPLDLPHSLKPPFIYKLLIPRPLTDPVANILKLLPNPVSLWCDKNDDDAAFFNNLKQYMSHSRTECCQKIFYLNNSWDTFGE